SFPTRRSSDLEMQRPADLLQLMVPLGLLRRELPGLDGDARLLGQARHHLDERRIFKAHEEVEHVPAGVTTEAVKQLLLRFDVKRRGLLGMKGAKPAQPS